MIIRNDNLISEQQISVKSILAMLKRDKIIIMVENNNNTDNKDSNNNKRSLKCQQQHAL